MLLTRVTRVPLLPLFILAHFTHHFATGALVPLLPWLRDDFQLDYFQAGLLVSAFPLVSGFAALPVAGVSNRWGKTRLIGIGLIGASFASAAMGFSPDFNFLFVFLLVMGVFASTYHALTSSFLSQVFSAEARGRSLGTHTIGGSASLLLTPAAAVAIAGFTGDWRYSFMALAIPALFVGLLVMNVGGRHEKASLASIDTGLRERMSLIEVARLIGVLVAIAAISMLVMSTITSYLPLYLVDKHHMPKELAGLIPSLVAGAGMIGAPLGGHLSDRFGRKPVIMGSVILIGPLLYLLTIVPAGPLTVTVPTILGILLVLGLVASARMPTIESLIADTVPWHRRASVLAIYLFLAQETGAVTTPFVGLFSNTYGLDTAFTILALFAVVSSGMVLLVRNKV